MVTTALLFANYGPYHFARLNSFYSFCKQRNWNTMGVEIARSQEEYAWQASVEYSNADIISVTTRYSFEKINKFHLISQPLFNVLDQIKPDVLAITGYAEPSMIVALLWSKVNRIPAILFSPSKEDDAPRVWWRETYKHWILKGYQAALVGGKPQKHYLMKLGMAPDRIFLGYNVVGNETFHPSKIKSLPTPLQKPYFLAINRFVPKKNILLLLSSYAAYRQAVGSSAWDLVLCGDGQLRSQIEKCIIELSIENSVHLPGFLQQDELLPYFAHAACFIHASIQEQWGLVVNEAMAASLPVLVSNRCGCFEDLVIEGINGFGFDPENPQQLTELMLKMSSREVDLQKMSLAALEHIQKFSPNYFAQNLMQAVEYTLAHRKHSKLL